jgi:hypothetical protein
MARREKWGGETGRGREKTLNALFRITRIPRPQIPVLVHRLLQRQQLLSDTLRRQILAGKLLRVVFCALLPLHDVEHLLLNGRESATAVEGTLD